MSDVQQRIDDLVKSNRVVLFMKGTAQFPHVRLLGPRRSRSSRPAASTDLKTVNVLEDEDVRQGIKDYANWPTIPQLYVNGEFVGGSDIMMEMYQAGELQQLLAHRPERSAAPRASSSASPAPPARSTACGCCERLRAAGRETHLVASPAGVLNVHHELGPRPQARSRRWPTTAYAPGDVGAAIASGSFATAGDGGRALLDEDAGGDRARPVGQPADARRRRHAEGAPPPAC